MATIQIHQDPGTKRGIDLTIASSDEVPDMTDVTAVRLRYGAESYLEATIDQATASSLSASYQFGTEEFVSPGTFALAVYLIIDGDTSNPVELDEVITMRVIRWNKSIK